jgi:hypothetical protein
MASLIDAEENLEPERSATLAGDCVVAAAQVFGGDDAAIAVLAHNLYQATKKSFGLAPDKSQ